VAAELVRVGIIGAGWVAGARHIPSLQKLEGVEIVALLDHDLGQAQLLAPPGTVATDNPESFYDLRPDAVFVCASPASHKELTLQAFAHGAHVLCEKPMATTRADARTMASASVAANRLLCIAHNFLWSDAMERARETLKGAGELRHVTGIQLSSERRRLPSWYPKLRGGLLFDEVPHMLYLFDELLGSELEVENVRAVWAGRPSEPRSCEVLLRGSRGVGQLTMVFDSPISEWHVASVAEKTLVDIDLFRDVMVSTGNDGQHRAREVLRTSTRATAGHLWGFAKAGSRLAQNKQLWGHDKLIADFVSAIRTGQPSPVAPEMALSVLNTAMTIVEAAESQAQAG